MRKLVKSKQKVYRTYGTRKQHYGGADLNKQQDSSKERSGKSSMLGKNLRSRSDTKSKSDKNISKSGVKKGKNNESSKIKSNKGKSLSQSIQSGLIAGIGSFMSKKKKKKLKRNGVGTRKKKRKKKKRTKRGKKLSLRIRKRIAELKRKKRLEKEAAINDKFKKLTDTLKELLKSKKDSDNKDKDTSDNDEIKQLKKEIENLKSEKNKIKEEEKKDKVTQPSQVIQVQSGVQPNLQPGMFTPQMMSMMGMPGLSKEQALKLTQKVMSKSQNNAMMKINVLDKFIAQVKGAITSESTNQYNVILKMLNLPQIGGNKSIKSSENLEFLDSKTQKIADQYGSNLNETRKVMLSTISKSVGDKKIEQQIIPPSCVIFDNEKEKHDFFDKFDIKRGFTLLFKGISNQSQKLDITTYSLGCLYTMSTMAPEQSRILELLNKTILSADLIKLLDIDESILDEIKDETRTILSSDSKQFKIKMFKFGKDHKSKLNEIIVISAREINDITLLYLYLYFKKNSKKKFILACKCKCKLLELLKGKILDIYDADDHYIKLYINLHKELSKILKDIDTINQRFYRSNIIQNGINIPEKDVAQHTSQDQKKIIGIKNKSDMWKQHIRLFDYVKDTTPTQNTQANVLTFKDQLGNSGGLPQNEVISNFPPPPPPPPIEEIIDIRNNLLIVEYSSILKDYDIKIFTDQSPPLPPLISRMSQTTDVNNVYSSLDNDSVLFHYREQFGKIVKINGQSVSNFNQIHELINELKIKEKSFLLEYTYYESSETSDQDMYLPMILQIGFKKLTSVDSYLFSQNCINNLTGLSSAEIGLAEIQDFTQLQKTCFNLKQTNEGITTIRNVSRKMAGKTTFKIDRSEIYKAFMALLNSDPNLDEYGATKNSKVKIQPFISLFNIKEHDKEEFCLHHTKGLLELIKEGWFTNINEKLISWSIFGATSRQDKRAAEIVKLYARQFCDPKSLPVTVTAGHTKKYNLSPYIFVVVKARRGFKQKLDIEKRYKIFLKAIYEVLQKWKLHNIPAKTATDLYCDIVSHIGNIKNRKMYKNALVDAGFNLTSTIPLTENLVKIYMENVYNYRKDRNKQYFREIDPNEGREVLRGDGNADRDAQGMNEDVTGLTSDPLDKKNNNWFFNSRNQYLENVKSKGEKTGAWFVFKLLNNTGNEIEKDYYSYKLNIYLMKGDRILTIKRITKDGLPIKYPADGLQFTSKTTRDEIYKPLKELRVGDYLVFEVSRLLKQEEFRRNAFAKKDWTGTHTRISRLGYLSSKAEQRRRFRWKKGKELLRELKVKGLSDKTRKFRWPGDGLSGINENYRPVDNSDWGHDERQAQTQRQAGAPAPVERQLPPPAPVKRQLPPPPNALNFVDNRRSSVGSSSVGSRRSSVGSRRSFNNNSAGNDPSDIHDDRGDVDPTRNKPHPTSNEPHRRPAPPPPPPPNALNSVDNRRSSVRSRRSFNNSSADNSSAGNNSAGNSSAGIYPLYDVTDEDFRAQAGKVVYTSDIGGSEHGVSVSADTPSGAPVGPVNGAVYSQVSRQGQGNAEMSDSFEDRSAGDGDEGSENRPPQDGYVSMDPNTPAAAAARAERLAHLASQPGYVDHSVVRRLDDPDYTYSGVALEKQTLEGDMTQFYHKNINMEKAERLLLDNNGKDTEGKFLIRDNPNKGKRLSKDEYALSVIYRGKPMHLLVKRENNTKPFKIQTTSKTFKTLGNTIANGIKLLRSDRLPDWWPVKLTEGVEKYFTTHRSDERISGGYYHNLEHVRDENFIMNYRNDNLSPDEETREQEVHDELKQTI